MMTAKSYLAFDLGAESGRGILGLLNGEKLSLKDVHRFPNVPVMLPDGLHWNVLRLWEEIKAGIGHAINQTQDIASIGLDTWGVDFALLDRQGCLIANPHHYRDARTDGMIEEAFHRVSREDIFTATGIQFLQINSLFQLLSMVKSSSPVMEIAHTFLTMPDLFNYWLCGAKSCELTNATTTQCFNPVEREWAWEVLETLGIPGHIFPKTINPGTVLGELSAPIRQELGIKAISIVAPACHDTGSAVVAVPAESERFAWISSGTWSVMGTEEKIPVITQQSLGNNFTNEGGVDNTWRFSKNVMGLWLVQECRRTWAAEGEDLSYADLTRAAAGANRLVSVVNPDYGEFFKPGDMPSRVQTYCEKTNQKVPESKAEIIRCILEGLALKYRFVLERLESMLGHRLEPIHIVGGGTQNTLLCQFTADATGRAVVAGPVEATAIGNILMQARAMGQLSSLSEARQVVTKSFDVVTYYPADENDWDDAFAKLLDLMKNGF